MRPVLYSFRRCPYAIRARLAVASAGVEVELREVVLRAKPDTFLAVSPSATVPCLVDGDRVIDESFDIMQWALALNDPEGLREMPAEGYALVERFDGPFKQALDLTKYAVRHPDSDPTETRATALDMLTALEAQLSDGWLFGAQPTLADFAILPFIRQFAMIDKPLFDGTVTPHASAWLESFLTSDRLSSVMQKRVGWAEGDPVTLFP